jgi:hypothetical protein
VRRVDSSTARALRALDEAARQPLASGPLELSPEYRRLIRACEALPENRSGADKTWVYRAQQEFRDYYAKVQPSR